jgi:predicted transcriptional regulator
MSETPRPTESELRILQVLWRRGPSTVREVHELVAAEKPSGYTTTLKFLQIMAGKGLVRREESSRTHVYEASRSEAETRRQLVGGLLDRVFGGSAKELVLHALNARKVSASEVREIRDLLDSLESRRRTSRGRP